MSRTNIWALGLFVAVAILWEQPANAQLRGSWLTSPRQFSERYLYNRPTVSPYLNLLNQQSTTGAPNYFTQVRPLLEQREQARRQTGALQQLQRQVTNVRQDLNRRTGPNAARVTGHPTRFMTYSHYYPTLNR